MQFLKNYEQDILQSRKTPLLIKLLKKEIDIISLVKKLKEVKTKSKEDNHPLESIALLERSFAIAQKLYVKNPTERVRNYIVEVNNLAFAYYDNKQFSEAIVMFEKSVEIHKEYYLGNPKVWTDGYRIALNNLAYSYKDNNQLYEAVNLMEKSLVILKKLYIEDPTKWVEEYVKL